MYLAASDHECVAGNNSRRASSAYSSASSQQELNDRGQNGKYDYSDNTLLAVFHVRRKGALARTFVNECLDNNNGYCSTSLVFGKPHSP